MSENVWWHYGVLIWTLKVDLQRTLWVHFIIPTSNLFWKIWHVSFVAVFERIYLADRISEELAKAKVFGRWSQLKLIWVPQLYEVRTEIETRLASGHRRCKFFGSLVRQFLLTTAQYELSVSLRKRATHARLDREFWYLSSKYRCSIRVVRKVTPDDFLAAGFGRNVKVDHSGRTSVWSQLTPSLRYCQL